MINCIAIDDEPLALEVIESHLSKIPFVNLVAKVRNPLQAIEIINNNDIHFRSEEHTSELQSQR